MAIAVTIAAAAALVWAPGSVPAAHARPGFAGAGPGVAVGSSDPVGSLSDIGPVSPERRTPERYLPSPSPDPWYSRPPVIAPGTEHGTILAERPASFPWYNVRRVARATQLLVATTDSRDNPLATVATVIEPSSPWTGPGPRPLVSYAVTIDALGMECMPSYAWTRGVSIEVPPILQILLDRGYGVVATDYEGPKGAYAAGRAEGREVLDGIRAARSWTPAGETEPLFGRSPIAQFGYSGGGIAAGWAAQLQPVYAPELSEVLVGSSLGGVVTDFEAVLPAMDGTVAAGLMRAAVFGLAREYPELYPLLNDTGDVVAHGLRDACAAFNTPAGLVTAPLAALTHGDALADPRVRRVLAENRLGTVGAGPGEVPVTPIQLWHADRSAPLPGGSVGNIGDVFVPADTVHTLRDEWCAAGVDITYTPVPGEHVLAAWTGIPPAVDWMDARFRGLPTTPSCPIGR